MVQGRFGYCFLKADYDHTVRVQVRVDFSKNIPLHSIHCIANATLKWDGKCPKDDTQ